MLGSVVPAPVLADRFGLIVCAHTRVLSEPVQPGLAWELGYCSLAYLQSAMYCTIEARLPCPGVPASTASKRQSQSATKLARFLAPTRLVRGGQTTTVKMPEQSRPPRTARQGEPLRKDTPPRYKLVMLQCNVAYF